MGHFQNELYRWYAANQRDLPWRNTGDPYKIWISEVILQQTRVVQATNYYLRFVENFPTVADLASANEQEVLKLWQGLGYYSRARNLHFAAKQIVREHGGNFPAHYSSILALKGVGTYTAAAVSSIAFGLPRPTVDGNVFRVLSRYFGIETPIDSSAGKKRFEKIANDLLPEGNPGFHNQALMEFGALQCVPKSPQCDRCPLQTTCFAAQNQKVGILPVKSKKTKQKLRFFYFFLIDGGDSIFLQKRTGNDIWRNLFQLPLAEMKSELTDTEIIGLRPSFINGIDYNLKMVSTAKKHILTHQIIFARLVHIETGARDLNELGFIRVNKKDIYRFAVPKLVEHFLHEMKLL